MAGLRSLALSCLLPGFAGTRPPAWVLRLADQGLGGVVLYGRNLAGASAAALAAPLRAARPDLIIATDEEGGDVTRLHYREGSPWPGNHALGAAGDPDLTYRVAADIARALAAAGVNVNLAPVVDVNSNPGNPVIGVRSFGDDPALVAAHSAAFVRGLQDAGVAACAKHFPGHGDTRTDSHLGLPTIQRGLAGLRACELVPFAAAVQAGAWAVMTAHVRFPALDEAPATLSPALIGLLRRELGFNGAVITDALDMAAITARASIPEAAVQALRAGADALCLGSTGCQAVTEATARAITAAVRSGELPEARLVEAAGRVAQLARQARPRAPAPAGPAAPDPGPAAPLPRAVGLEAARRALHAEGDLPLGSPLAVVELAPATNPAVGATAWGLASALAELGALAGAARLRAAPADLRRVLARFDGVPLVVAIRDAHRHPWQQAVLAGVLARRPDAAVVSMGLPADRPAAARTWLAAHGAGRANALAAAERLAGRPLAAAPPAGRTARGSRAG